MEQLAPALFVIAIIGLFAGLIIYALHLDKKRREALQALFSKLGFSFQAKGNSLSQLMFSDLPLFSRGHSRTLKNYAEAQIGAATLCYFDYSYTTGHKKNRSTSHFSVVGIGGNFGLPEFTLGPEDFFSKVAQAVGYDDIDLPSDPDFSRAFVLRSPQPAQVQRVFSRPVVDMIKRIREIQLEASANGIIWIRRGSAEPEEIGRWLEEARSLFGLISPQR